MNKLNKTRLIFDPDSNPGFYGKLNHQWNLRLSKVYPLAYVVPQTTEDVEDTVKCGSDAQIPVTPKSGGHSYEGYSFGTNDSIVIDFRDMDQVIVNQTDHTALIGPGNISLSRV